MLVTVKEASGVPVWKSPDGRVSIYDIVDQDGNKWSTKSHKIGQGQGQSFEVEIEQKGGKTYLRLPYNPNSAYPATGQPAPQAPAQTSQSNAPSVSQFTAAVDKFSDAVDRLSALVNRNGETVLKEIDPEAVAEFLGGEIVDDGPNPEDREPEGV